MSTAISEEPRLMTVSACLDELKKCIHWERHHQMDYDQVMKENPAGTARVMQSVAGYWRERRMRVEARFKELNELSRS